MCGVEVAQGPKRKENTPAGTEVARTLNILNALSPNFFLPKWHFERV